MVTGGTIGGSRPVGLSCDDQRLTESGRHARRTNRPPRAGEQVPSRSRAFLHAAGEPLHRSGRCMRARRRRSSIAAGTSSVMSSSCARPAATSPARSPTRASLVMRGKDGKLRGFYNVCSHRAHELLKGCGTAKVITCPYHAWSYHSDGRLRTARGSEKMAGFDADEFCLKQVQVEELCGFVFVNLDPQATPLKEQSGNLESEMRRLLSGDRPAHPLAPADLRAEGQLEERRRQFPGVLPLLAGPPGVRRPRRHQELSHGHPRHLFQPHRAAPAAPTTRPIRSPRARRPTSRPGGCGRT